MLNRQSYKPPKEATPFVSRGVIIKVFVVVLCFTLLATSIRTIRLIYGTESEKTQKVAIQRQAYIELIKTKNEEKAVSSKSFIQSQGRQASNLILPNEKKLVITNEYELEAKYQLLLAESKKQLTTTATSKSNPWQQWLKVILLGL